MSRRSVSPTTASCQAVLRRPGSRGWVWGGPPARVLAPDSVCPGGVARAELQDLDAPVGEIGAGEVPGQVGGLRQVFHAGPWKPLAQVLGALQRGGHDERWSDS